VRIDRHGIVLDVDPRARFSQHLENGVHVAGSNTVQRQRPACRRGCHQKRSRLDAIGDRSEGRAVQALDPMNGDDRSPGTFDAGAHGAQEVGEIGDFRLERCVLDDDAPAPQRRRQEHVLRPTDGRLAEHDVSLQGPVALDDEIALLLVDRCSQRFERLKVAIHGTRPERTSTRHTDPRAPHSCE